MKQLIFAIQRLWLFGLLCAWGSIGSMSSAIERQNVIYADLYTSLLCMMEPYARELDQLVVEYVDTAKKSGESACVSRGISNWYAAIQEGKEVILEDLKDAIAELITYVHSKLDNSQIRAPRPTSLEAQLLAGPDNCHLASVLTFLHTLQNAYDQCCQTILEDLIYTNSVIENINLDLDMTLSTFDEFVATFSNFEQMVIDIQNTFTELVVAVNQLANTVTLIESSLQGTFTALEACCQELTADFQETGTIITGGFSSLYVDIASDFNGTTSSFVATWSIIQDIKEMQDACPCLGQFQSTWTIINEIIENSCPCSSEFQQTWTMLNNITDIVGDVCACKPEFQQTWTIIEAGFNGTYTNFQGTYTVLQAGFQGTWSMIDNLTLCGLVSIFDDEIVSTREDSVSIQFPYGVSGFDTTTSTFNGGFVNSFTSMAIVSTGTAATGFAQIRSLAAMRYSAGHEADLFFTARFINGGVADSTQWIGLLDEVDGMAVGFNGTTFSILYRNNGADTIIPQTSFNIDPLNGTGSSGFILNPQTLNVFRIAYGWVGASPILFQVVDQNGEWTTFHTISTTNTLNGPSLSNPYLPITAQVRKTAGAANISIATASWNASSIQEQSIAGSRYFATQISTLVTPTGSFETHVLTIRNKSTYQGKPNKISLRVGELTAGPAIGSSDSYSGRGYFKLRRQATVTGTSFTDVNTANSIVEYSTVGVYNAATGMQLFALECNPSPLTRATPATLFNSQEANITIYPGETLTVTYLPIGFPTNLSLYASLTWEEQF